MAWSPGQVRKSELQQVKAGELKPHIIFALGVTKVRREVGGGALEVGNVSTRDEPKSKISRNEYIRDQQSAWDPFKVQK